MIFHRDNVKKKFVKKNRKNKRKLREFDWETLLHSYTFFNDLNSSSRQRCVFAKKIKRKYRKDVKDVHMYIYICHMLICFKFFYK